MPTLHIWKGKAQEILHNELNDTSFGTAGRGISMANWTKSNTSVR